MTFSIIFVFSVIGIIIFDLLSKMTLTKAIPGFILFCLLSHSVAIILLAPRFIQEFTIPVHISMYVFIVYFFVRFFFYEYNKKADAGARLKIMMGGHRLLITSIFATYSQIPICILLYNYGIAKNIDMRIIYADIAVCAVFILVFSINGVLRMACTSRRLGILWRVLLILFGYIPIVNIPFAIICCKKVKEEYYHDSMAKELQQTRATQSICCTKYPIVFLHGIGFQDSKLFNYWGRIPKLLKMNGANVYYGQQAACETIEKSGEQIKQTIINVLNETGAEKVNIIAHSKGGLDARYMISKLDMANYVATLTTMSTPHYGSELAAVAEKLSYKKYKELTNHIDKIFLKMGEATVDSYHAIKQLSPAFLEEFNINTPDDTNVYYQSYGASMKGVASDGILGLPYAIMRILGGYNDGLVSTDSARWGSYKGVITGTKRRGVSHGDLIDLKRQDYNGFDICEQYVQIVAELKQMGY